MFLKLVAFGLTALILFQAALIFSSCQVGEAYFTVQICAGWAWFAVPIVAAIVANGALSLAEHRRDRIAARAALISSALIVVTLVIFFIWVFPANYATSNWTLIPDSWAELRRHWEYGHAANALILFAALLATGRTLISSSRER